MNKILTHGENHFGKIVGILINLTFRNFNVVGRSDCFVTSEMALRSTWKSRRRPNLLIEFIDFCHQKSKIVLR